MERIIFAATVAKLATLADGGLRLTLDLPETAIMQAAQLMECKRAGAVLLIDCDPRGGVSGIGADPRGGGSGNDAETQDPAA
jgi:hypothetical protein